MLHNYIINKIKDKIGCTEIASKECEYIAGQINNGSLAPIISVTTVKRLLGLTGAAPEPRYHTLNIVSQWLGYDDYKALLREIGEGGAASVHAPKESIDPTTLAIGARIEVKYEPSRTLVLAYAGDYFFEVITAKNSQNLLPGDMLRITLLVKGMELYALDHQRDGRSMGPYNSALNGGLTSLRQPD